MAELRVLTRRPAPLLVLLATIGVVLAPAYLSGWAGLRTAQGLPGVEGIAASLAPSSAPGFAVGVFAAQGGLLAFALGALPVGRDYGWATAATRALHLPQRHRAALGRMAATWLLLLGVALLGVLSVVLLAAVTPVTGLDAPTGPPRTTQLLSAVAIAWVILVCWAAAGTLLATLLRSATAALAIAATYLLSIEQTLRGTAGHLEIAADIQRVLLVGMGRSAGALLTPSATGFRPVHPPLALAILIGLSLTMAAAAVALGRQDL